MCPCLAGTGVDSGAHAILLEHDVALYGWSCLILAGFDNSVLARGARAQHFEDNDRIKNDGGGPVDRGADDHAVRISDVALSDLELEVAAIITAWLPSQARPERSGHIRLNVGMPSRSAGHGDGTDAIELVAQRLPFLPFEELGERHGSQLGEAHERVFITDWGGRRRRAIGAAMRRSARRSLSLRCLRRGPFRAASKGSTTRRVSERQPSLSPSTSAIE